MAIFAPEPTYLEFLKNGLAAVISAQNGSIFGPLGPQAKGFGFSNPIFRSGKPCLELGSILKSAYLEAQKRPTLACQNGRSKAPFLRSAKSGYRSALKIFFQSRAISTFLPQPRALKHFLDENEDRTKINFDLLGRQNQKYNNIIMKN